MTKIFIFIFLSFLSMQAFPEKIQGTSPVVNLTLTPEKDFLQVLPYPGNGIFSVLYRSELKGQVMLAVVDATGKYVYLKTIRDFNGEFKEVVDLSSNPKGLYIFEVESNTNLEIKKVIFQ